MTLLTDGRYDVVVVDARDISETVVHLELTIASGEHRGLVVEMTAHHLARASVDVLGAPATLVVKDGAPRVEWD